MAEHTDAVDIAGSPIRGEFLEVSPPHRVVVRCTTADSRSRAAGHAAGWAHFLPRLAIAAAGGDVGADDWRPLSPPPGPSRTP